MVAEAMDSVARRTSDSVCRYGGEEFAIILPNTPLKGAINVTQTIRQEIEKLQLPHQGSQISQYITISLGVSSIIPAPKLSKVLLIEKTDNALYAATNNGRNKVEFENTIPNSEFRT